MTTPDTTASVQTAGAQQVVFAQAKIYVEIHVPCDLEHEDHLRVVTAVYEALGIPEEEFAERIGPIEFPRNAKKAAVVDRLKRTVRDVLGEKYSIDGFSGCFCCKQSNRTHTTCFTVPIKKQGEDGVARDLVAEGIPLEGGTCHIDIPIEIGLEWSRD